MTHAAHAMPGPLAARKEGEHVEELLRLRNLRLDVLGDDGRERPILRGIDLSVRAGEAVGIVGESGSGKSMTLRCVTRLTPPGSRVRGEVLVNGRDVDRLRGRDLRRFRQREIGFVFQDPRAAINPMRTVGDFLLEVARDRGEDETAARASAVDVLTGMGITDPDRRMRQYPFELSGGLLQRVMIASVLMGRPSLLLADEPTTALDVTTQSDVLALTDRLCRDSGIAMLFVTHDLDLAMAVCDKIAVLYAGQILEFADAESMRDRPLHPYTRGLLASRPSLGVRMPRIPVIPGAPITAADAGPLCSFSARCPLVLPNCERRPPPLQHHSGTSVLCHRADEIAAGTVPEGAMTQNALTHALTHDALTHDALTHDAAGHDSSRPADGTGGASCTGDRHGGRRA